MNFCLFDFKGSMSLWLNISDYFFYCIPLSVLSTVMSYNLFCMLKSNKQAKVRLHITLLTHLRAPEAVSLTARLPSSSMGPRRLTAPLWRKPGMLWLCCTTREMLAHANSRTSALGLCNCRDTKALKTTLTNPSRTRKHQIGLSTVIH